MEKEKRLPLKVSLAFLQDLEEIFDYGINTSRQAQAGTYENGIWELIE